MKSTLHTFFQRTAHSRDANDFLLQYNSLEYEQFLLMIPVLDSADALQDFVAEVQYLLRLDLYPDLLVAEHFVGEEFREKLQSHFGRGEDALKIWSCTESEFLGTLLQLAEKNAYYKYMWTGGAMRDLQGKIASRVHLNNSRQAFSSASAEVLPWAKPLLIQLGPAYSLQLVAPHQILPELFTRFGAGTMMSLGYQFFMKTIAELELEKLKTLLEQGFARKLKEDYFETLPPKTKVLVEENFSGAIVVESWESIYYLDKVVVKPQFFGRGLGSMLLDELTQQLLELSGKCPKLCWRARPDNPYLSRYASLVYGFSEKMPMQCGTVSDGHYVYHFIGLGDDERRWALEKMQQRETSFVVEHNS